MMNRRRFLGWLASSAAILSTPLVKIKRKIFDVWVVRAKTTKREDGWYTTTKTYSNGWTLVYDHTCGVDIHMYDEDQLTVTGPVGRAFPRNIFISSVDWEADARTSGS